MIDHFVLSDMLKTVTAINPDYPADKDCDYTPLRKIAQFIAKQLQGQDILVAEPGLFMRIWERLYTVAHSDQFYSDKSLATIANHIQEFYQKAKNNNGKLSGSKLGQKLAARFNSK
jgi:hypothetical protein